MNFDREGNYCFEIKKDGQEYFVTNNDTIGGFHFIGSIYGKNGEVSYTEEDFNIISKPYYYKNAKGTKVYGSAIGKIQDYQTSNTKESIGIVTSLMDSVYYYINGNLISKRLSDPKKSYSVENDWVAFSENGNTIYYIDRNNHYFLFVNDKLIDSSNFSYTQLAINNQGNYIFAKGKRPEQPIGKYNYMFFIHTKDTVLDYVRTVWNYQLKENGAYYYIGDDNGPKYIAINNQLHKNLDAISNITILNKDSYLFSFKEKGNSKINFNGKIYEHKFDKISYPTLDKQGNFAFYGMKNYYLYKYINGKFESNPITKFGVRPTPIYISPTGESIHYFKTEDSIYLFQDDSLIFKPIHKSSNFILKPWDEFIPNHFVHGKTANGNSLFYLEYNKDGYFVFNGKFSKAMHPILERSFSKDYKKGAIVAGVFNDNGFFAIQKTDNKKFLITVNNQVYKEIDGVDSIIADSFFLDEKKLIFYGIRGFSFYQFTLMF